MSLPAAAKDIAVISNKANSVKTLGLNDLVKICKGVTRRWPDGREITFVMRDPDSRDMKMLLQRVYQMNPDQVRALITSANQGRRDKPVILVSDSDEAVLKAVQTIPGAVGVVDVYSITGAINVLKIEGRVPLDPGYVLHGN
ncbi:MAG: substrate-binding domain-containing protein [Acidobacteriaceae bacterium]|nr:substrate-binding domain-containing protein [Acidobacteriaceae bacterium]